MKTRVAGIVLLASVGIAGLIYLLFFAKLFDVRAVEVISPSAIPSEEVHRVAVNILERKWLTIARKSNGIVFSPEKIRDELMRTIPRIKDVVIRRVSLHRIEITITERQPVGLWCLVKKETCYYFDEGGTAFAKLLPVSGYLFIAINDSRDRSVELGARVAPETWIKHILEVKRHLQFGGISISEIQIPDGSYEEFHIVTREGWKIFMSNDTDIDRQITSMLQFIKQNFTTDQRRQLQYIDLRVDDRIYYK